MRASGKKFKHCCGREANGDGILYQLAAEHARILGRAYCAAADRVRVRVRVTFTDGFAGNGQPIDCTIEHGADPIPVASTVIRDRDAKVAHIFGASPKQVRSYAKSLTVKELAADGYTVETGSRFGDFVDDIALPFRKRCSGPTLNAAA